MKSPESTHCRAPLPMAAETLKTQRYFNQQRDASPDSLSPDSGPHRTCDYTPVVWTHQTRLAQTKFFLCSERALLLGPHPSPLGRPVHLSSLPPSPGPTAPSCADDVLQTSLRDSLFTPFVRDWVLNTPLAPFCFYSSPPKPASKNAKVFFVSVHLTLSLIP